VFTAAIPFKYFPHKYTLLFYWE